MTDPEVRVFDSVSAAVANSAPPPPPPYAPAPESAGETPPEAVTEEVPATPPPAKKAPAKSRQVPTGHSVAASAGTAGVRTKANDTK